MARQLLNIRVEGMKPKEFQRYVERQFINIENGMIKLGVDTRDRMREALKNKITREGSTGNLANSIHSYVERYPQGILVGVGSIDYMTKVAPYWYIINYGGYTTISARGMSLWGWYGAGNKPDASLRGTGVGRERFTSVTGGNLVNLPTIYRMTPTAPIAPKYYIERTKAWLLSQARIHFSGWVGKTQVFKK